MISLFLSTATKKIVFSIIKDDKIIYSFNENNDNKLSERIMPIIDDGFNATKLSVNDIDTIFIVNGPGSFTGIRIGVTIAKVYAWSLKKRIVCISSLEMLASTKFNTDYIVPLIDARRGYVFAGIYDKNGKCILKDQHILLSELINTSKQYNVSFVSEDEFDFETMISDYDVLSLVNRHKKDESINPHKVNPNYLKLTEAEENLMKKNDN